MGETPMNRSPVRRGSSQLAIAVLLLADLAGCGKQEAAPVVRPPAVPVFEPQAVEVKLGKSGDSVTLRTTEAGGFTLEGKAVESGAEVRAENGNVYTLTLEDGEWTAIYNAPEVELTLGEHGGSATIETAEDSTYRLDGELFESGGTVRAENGNMYTLTLVDGEWIVAFNAPGPVSVTLGTSGTTVTIETAEDGSYWLDEEFFESGDTVAAQNGNTYILTLVAGEWSPVFQPKSMEIIGIDLMAMSREDGTGYDVGDQELDEYGWGDIVIDGDHFRVSRNDMGMLMAEQFDAKSEAFLTDREASRNKFGGTLPDNEDTAYNEAGTKLTIDGTEYSIGELFDDGEASRKSANIVAEQRKAIERALTRINRLIAVIKAGNEDETGREGDFNQQFIDRWSDIDDALDNIFGDPDAGADPNTDNEESTISRISPRNWPISSARWRKFARLWPAWRHSRRPSERVESSRTHAGTSRTKRSNVSSTLSSGSPAYVSGGARTRGLASIRSARVAVQPRIPSVAAQRLHRFGAFGGIQ